MAYQSFVELGGAAAVRAQLALQAPTETLTPRTSGLSGLEWSVVALARRDTMSSLRQPSRIALAMGSLFGLRGRTALADPRLEALRRTAVLAWHRGDDIPTTEIRAFLEAGFTPDQYETMMNSIARARLDSRGRRH